MFELKTFTEATLATLTNRSEKHGEDNVPAVSLGLELTVCNTVLDAIDPAIRDSLYKAVEGQDDLPGVERSTPVLRCNSIERVVLPTRHEGWTLQVDDGIDDTKPMVFGGCKVDKLSVEPKQGGSIVLRLRIGTSDLDAARTGMLGMHVGQPIWITLIAPKPGEEPRANAAKDDKEPDATGLFAGTGDEAPPQSATTEVVGSPKARTARGRAATKAALAAGTH